MGRIINRTLTHRLKRAERLRTGSFVDRAGFTCDERSGVPCAFEGVGKLFSDLVDIRFSKDLRVFVGERVDDVNLHLFGCAAAPTHKWIAHVEVGLFSALEYGNFAAECWGNEMLSRPIYSWPRSCGLGSSTNISASKARQSPLQRCANHLLLLI